jgi:hypothetical protein
MAFGGSLEGGADWDEAAAQLAVDNVRAFWAAINGLIPNEITLTVSPVVDVYSTVGGALVGSYQAPIAPVVVAGLDSGVYSMASGVKMQWNTGVILNGRRVRGSTYIVPAGSSAFANTGTVAAGARTTLQTAGNTLISAAETDLNPFGVWSRPENTTSNDGVFSAIAGAEAVEKGAVLRGRRD